MNFTVPDAVEAIIELSALCVKMGVPQPHAVTLPPDLTQAERQAIADALPSHITIVEDGIPPEATVIVKALEGS